MRPFKPIIRVDQMTRSESFRAGYVEGWRAMAGGGVGVPSCAMFGVSHGRTSYQEGIRRAVEITMARKLELATRLQPDTAGREADERGDRDGDSDRADVDAE